MKPEKLEYFRRLLSEQLRLHTQHIREDKAAALDLSVGSVGTTLSRARRRLMEAYESLQSANTAEPA